MPGANAATESRNIVRIAPHKYTLHIRPRGDLAGAVVIFLSTLYYRRARARELVLSLKIGLCNFNVLGIARNLRLLPPRARLGRCNRAEEEILR